MGPASRGTPELKKAMDQKRKRNEAAWEVYTGRSADGNFGDASKVKKGDTDPYDPFATIGAAFTQEAASLDFEVGEFNPAVQVGVMNRASVGSALQRSNTDEWP